MNFDYNLYKTILRERHLIFIPHLRTNLSNIGPILTIFSILFYVFAAIKNLEGLCYLKRPLYSKVHVHM